MPDKQFVIPAGALRAAVVRAASAVKRREVVPVLRHLLLSASSGTLCIAGTDTWTIIKAWAEGEGYLPAITADARALTVICENLRDDDEVRMHGIPGDRLEIETTSGLHVQLPSHPTRDFPNPDRENRSASWSIPAATLHEILSAVRHAISDEETRYYLNGAFLHPSQDGERLLFAATNGHRLMERSCPAPSGGTPLPMIIPRRAIAKLLPLLDGDGWEVCVLQGNLSISILGSGWTLHAKTIDGTFPDYPRVIPKEPGTELTVHQPERLARIAAGIGCVADRHGDFPKIIHLNRLDDGGFTLSAQHVDTGFAQSIVPGEVASWGAGFDLTVGFQLPYLQDLLAALPGGFTMHVLDSSAPCRVTAEGATAVLMPIRLS